MCTLVTVCAQRSCPSRLLCLFCGWDHCGWLHSQTRGGFPPGPLYPRAVVHLGLDGRGGGGKQKRARRCGHTRAVSTCTDVPACCACVTGARETLGVCAPWVCATVVSVSSAVSFLRMGSLRVVTLPDPGGPGPLSSLRGSVITRTHRSLPSSHGCLVGWVPSMRSYHLTGEVL